MVTLIEAVKSAGKRAFCSLQSAGYNAWYLFSRLAEGDIASAGKFAEASNGLFCNNPVSVPFGSLPSPPFSGGQCECIAYSVQIEYKERDESGISVYNGVVYGPILGLRVAPFTYNVNVGPDSGRMLLLDARDGNCNVNAFQIRGIETGASNFPYYRIVSVGRVDGQPDSCGSPPAPVPPYEPGSTTIVDDITYEPEGGGPQITIPATVILGFAYVDANANIRIPVTVNLGGIKIPLSLNLTTGDINLGGIRVGSPDIDIKLDVRIGGPGGVTIPPGMEPPIGPPPGEPDYPEIGEPPGPDTEPIIVGAVITTNHIVGRRDILYQDGGNPNIEIPRLGFVNFLNYVPGLGLAWSEDIPVKNLRHLVQNPWPHGAVAVEGSPRNGVTWTITPVYKQAQLPIEYPDLVEV